MTPSVLSAYGLEERTTRVEPFGSGLINRTWKVCTQDRSYILQRINEAVFTEPQVVAHNIRLVGDYLQQHHPQYLFVAPVRSLSGEDMIHLEGEGYFRLFPFVPHSHSIDVVQTPGQAYEAAVQFGRFTRLLSGLDVEGLQPTIPGFHDLSWRYQQFLTSLEEGNAERAREADDLVQVLKGYSDIVLEYKRIKSDPQFRLRVIHHDTKISNVLFDPSDKGICVIDLDTIMPGYFISDVGDMMRTYLSPVSEEESDVSKIEVRDDFYKAIVQGYLQEMKDELTSAERGAIFYAGKFMIYMQALRFLTDHINNDRYYGARYEGHNLVRARNQVVLLQRLAEKESVLSVYQR